MATRRSEQNKLSENSTEAGDNDLLTNSAFSEKKETYWNEVGSARALSLFHKAKLRIPAYKDMLKKARVDGNLINSIEDFCRLPILTKHNYVEQYPLTDRLWDGNIDKTSIIATSSGTTGAPVYWARGKDQEAEATLFHELLYKELFQIDQHTTLLIIGFPMGVYISGIATTLPSFHVAEAGYPLTLLTPGMNRDAIIGGLKNLSSSYEQTVLVGHPFFLKNILETARDQGIDLPKLNIKLLCCSEGFNEEWREYVSALLGGGNTPRIFNTYGSSEFLLMGAETPFTISARKIIGEDPALCESLFKTKQTPNLFQYNPLMRYIEEEGTRLLFTCMSGVPLIRYELGDRGTLLSCEELRIKMAENRLAQKPSWQLPVVALKGRSDDAVVFYGANIYVEHVRGALDHLSLLPYITGKFRVSIDYSKEMDPSLLIDIELRGVPLPDSDDAFVAEAEDCVTKYLLDINIEYRSSVEHVQKNLRPLIRLHVYQDADYFPVGLKPKFIIR